MQNQCKTATYSFLERIDMLREDLLPESTSVDLINSYALSITSFLNWFKIKASQKKLHHGIISEEILTPHYESYFYHYVFPQICKDLGLLYRDVIINLNRGHHKLIDKKISQTTLDTLVVNSNEALKNAINDSVRTIEKEVTKVDALTVKQFYFHINTFHTPQEIILKQLDSLNVQIENQKNLPLALHTINQVYDDVFNHIDTLKDVQHRFLSFITENSMPLPPSINSVDDAITHIKKLMVELEKIAIWDATQETHIFDSIKNQPNLSIPIRIDHGKVISRQLNMYKSLSKWYEAEIATEIVEVFSKQEMVRTNVLSQFSSLLNNLRFAQSKERDLDSVQLKKQEDRLEYEYSSFSELTSKKFDLLSDRLNNNLRVSLLFEEQELFVVPFHKPLNKYGNTSLKQANTFAKVVWDKVRSKYNAVLPVDNVQSKLASQELIDFRLAKDYNEQYDALFLNRAYIGDLFQLEREPLLDQATRAFSMWNNGYDGGLLVSGDRLSGKTSFLESIIKKLAIDRPVKLRPGINTTINGRKFLCEKDIEITLQEILKNSDPSDKHVLLFDDLELWHNTKDSLLDIAKKIKEFISLHGDQFFIMVSCTNGTANALQSWLSFNDSFTAVLDVSKSSEELIVSALMLRHEASQQELINEEGDVLTEYQLQKRIRKIASHCTNNIGNCLQTWTYMTNQTEGEKVHFKLDLVKLKDTYTNEQKLILQQLDRYLQLDDLSLKEKVNFEDEKRYSETIVPLFHSKILVRNVTNGITINPVIVNEVHKIIA